MAATVNVSAKAFSASAGSTLQSASVTIGGSNRVLYVLAVGVAGTPQSCTGVKWGGSGGTALTQLGTEQVAAQPGWSKASLWRLIAPTAQSSTVYATFAGSNDERFMFIVSVQDADQTTPNNTLASATGTGVAAPPSTDATSVSGDLVLDFLHVINGGGEGPTLTKDASQTLLQKYDASAINAFEGGGTSYKTASGTSTTMTWAVSAGSSTTGWGIYALAVNASAGAPPSVVPQIANFYQMLRNA